MKSKLATPLSLLLGLVFIVSAVAKLWSIDQFELYVYSYGVLPLNLSYIAVRLCIGAELAIGACLVAGVKRLWALLCATGLLVFFSIFLCYAALIGRNDSCQCFGQLADMPPAVSLLKNAVLLVLTLFALSCEKKRVKKSSKLYKTLNSTWLTIVLVAIMMTIPFVVSIPDSWMFGPSEERYNAESLNDAVTGPLVDYDLDKGRHLVAFVTPGCPYCRMARQKLDSMAKRNNLDPNSIVFIEPKDMPADIFLKITYGARPLIMLIDNGEVAYTYHYRNINERQIVRFLCNKI